MVLSLLELTIVVRVLTAVTGISNINPILEEPNLDQKYKV
jgi:hypothetical protein